MTHKEKILWTKQEWLLDKIEVIEKSKIHGTIDSTMVTISQGMLVSIIGYLKSLAESIPDLHKLCNLSSPGSGVTRERVNSNPSAKSSIPTWNSNHPSRIAEDDDRSIA